MSTTCPERKPRTTPAPATPDPLPAAPLAPPSETSVYNRTFWLAYIANVVLVTANALSFRFAELVAYLGGSEEMTGSIIRTGLIGTLVLRLAMGRVIDRYGAGRLWAFSSLGFILGCLAFTMIGAAGWQLHAARLLFASSLAGMFTCSIVHIQEQVPPHRRTEVLGNLGSSGFVGMIIGSQLGDVILKYLPESSTQFLILFGAGAGLGVVYLVIVLLMMVGNKPHERPHEQISSIRLLVRYWPGPVVAVALLMGVTFGVTTVFLTRFSTQLKLGGIGTFFTAYAISAFIFRITTSNWSHKHGRHAMILRGLLGHFVGMSSLIFVSREWHFIFPAIAGGFGHALLFPAVVSLGAGAFPKRHRGTGTTLVLGFVEAGTMLSAPLLGLIIDRYQDSAALKYGFTPMFGAAAVLALLVAAFYALTAARQPDIDTAHHEDMTEEDRLVLAAAGVDDDDVAALFPHLGRNP